jgi:DinB family protein
MDAVTYAQQGLKRTFGLFNQIADGMTPEQYNWKPAGTANAIGKTHVHAMTSVDLFINGTLAGAEMRWKAFAAEQGLPPNPIEIWSFSGEISLDAMKTYSHGVQEAALAYVASLTDPDLDREVDTAFFGKQTAAFMIGLTGIHVMGHGGDMAAVKGLQGLKGLPF